MTMTEQERDLDSVLTAALQGYQRTQLVYLIVKLGVPDGLAPGPRSSAELAASCAADPGAMLALLRAGAAEGLMAELEPGRFALTPLGGRLRRDAGGAMRSRALLAGEEFYQAWGASLTAIRTGSSGFEHVYGRTFWGYLAQHPEKALALDAIMTSSASAWTKAIAASSYFATCSTVVDVGGGTGSVLLAILQAHPGLTGTLFEVESLAARARALVGHANVLDRCSIRVGSFLETVPEGADRYLLCRVLGDWADADAVRILLNCRRAMRDDSRLMIVARLTDAATAGARPMFDLHMPVVVGGRDRTCTEYAALLAAAGLAVREVRAVDDTDLSMIEAAPVVGEPYLPEGIAS